MIGPYNRLVEIRRALGVVCLDNRLAATRRLPEVVPLGNRLAVIHRLPDAVQLKAMRPEIRKPLELI